MARTPPRTPPRIPSGTPSGTPPRRPAGSTARARRGTRKVAVTLNETAPERWLANIRLSGFTLMMLALLILGVLILAPSLKLLIEQHDQIGQLEKSVSQQKHDVSNLKGQVARWDDPAYIEAQARDRLLFVFPGEYSYLVISSGAQSTTPDGAPISKVIQNTQVDWVKSLTASLLTAGLSKAAPSTINSPLQAPVQSPKK